MSNHHPKSPSKLERLASCPISYKICQGWENPDGEYAERGSLLHNAIYDDSAYNQLPAKEQEMINVIRREHIEPYRHLEHYHELYVEVYDGDVLLTAGTLDDLVIRGELASLKDWKFGSYEVTRAADNMQIKPYVVGIFQKFQQVMTVYVLIVQPVYGVFNYDDQAEFHRDQLPELIAEIKAVCDRAEAATENDYNCTPDNCRYCNKERCRAYKEKLAQAAEDFGMEGIESSFPVEEIITHADEMLCKVKLLENMIEARKKAFQSAILAAGGSANFRVQAGRVTRKTDWNNLCRDHEISNEIIDGYTVETQGEPYLMPRMRKPKQLSN